MARKRAIERLSYSDGFFDITGVDDVEIMVSDAVHGLWPVVHIITRTGTKLRICQIRGTITIKDTRLKK